jgi:pimeloyl-ACP methyl ester carboxylesterase
VVYVGHSGGAAIGGVLIGRRRGLVDAAVLVSCPCDIDRWNSGHKREPWTRSLSPSMFAHRVPTETQVVAITGERDANTPPALARSYVAKLSERGVSARAVIVDGASHGFSGLREVTNAEANKLIGR